MIVNKLNFPKLSPELKDVLIGTLLGDCSLQTYTHGRTWRARFLQSDQHRDYLFHLYELYKDYVGTPPKLSDDGLGNKRWSFNTRVVPELNSFADLFYEKRGDKFVKVIKPEVCKLITPLSLAYWYMDDGSLKTVKNTQAYILCTDSFIKDEVLMLGEMFKSIYDIHVSYHLKGGNYRIYIPVKHTERFGELIGSKIHESMRYKIKEKIQ